MNYFYTHQDPDYATMTNITWYPYCGRRHGMWHMIALFFLLTTELPLLLPATPLRRCMPAGWNDIVSSIKVEMVSVYGWR